MIKFFRKIRQNMIKENKVSKYLLYAIGEIVLVVIGILIALSINNWNENRKLTNDLGLIQLSLISELSKDSESIKKELNLLNEDVRKLNNYFLRMSNESINKDSLVKIFNLEFNPVIYGGIKFNNSIINTLKASGNFIKLEKWLQEDLFKILEMKENYFTTHSDIANYVDVLTLSGNNYPRSIEPLKKSSKLNKAIWQNVEFNELGAYMNNVFGVKYITSKQSIESLQKINVATINLLRKLK